MKTPPVPIPPVYDLLGQEIKEGTFVVYSAPSSTSCDIMVGLVVGFAWTKSEKWRETKPKVLVRFRQANSRWHWDDSGNTFDFFLPDGSDRKLVVNTKRLSSSSDHERFVVIPEGSLSRDFAAFTRARA